MPERPSRNLHRKGEAARGKSFPEFPFIVGLGTMILAAHTSGISAVFPFVAEGLGISVVRGQGILAAYTLALTRCVLVCGGLADRFGLRRVYIAGMAVFGISSCACALASGPLVLISLRVVEGCGAAMVSATSVALIGANIPRWRLGRAVGCQTGLTYAGLTLGPVVAGFLLERLGWRALFTANLPIAAIAVVLAKRIPGELRQARPQSPSEHFRNLPLGKGIVCAVADESIFYFGLHAIVFLTPIYLVRVRALPVAEEASSSGLQNAARALAAPFSGRLCDRVRPRTLVLSGIASLSSFRLRHVLLPCRFALCGDNGCTGPARRGSGLVCACQQQGASQ
jgi:MFS family permease